MPKVFHCSSFGGQHKRPVEAKCQVQIAESNDSIASDMISDTNPDDINTQILTALNLVSSRRESRGQKSNSRVRLDLLAVKWLAWARPLLLIWRRKVTLRMTPSYPQ